ncbi:MAG: hypothetical protein H0U76_09615 [Ktedonobacteraceae bacterium]|nr:hypothetical protein [Ktedonobacteraceae bacterium]
MVPTTRRTGRCCLYAAPLARGNRGSKGEGPPWAGPGRPALGTAQRAKLPARERMRGGLGERRESHEAMLGVPSLPQNAADVAFFPSRTRCPASRRSAAPQGRRGASAHRLAVAHVAAWRRLRASGHNKADGAAAILVSRIIENAFTFFALRAALRLGYN